MSAHATELVMMLNKRLSSLSNVISSLAQLPALKIIQFLQLITRFNAWNSEPFRGALAAKFYALQR